MKMENNTITKPLNNKNNETIYRRRNEIFTMIKYTDKNGKSTGWLSKNPTTKELERLNIDQLLIIAKNKKGLKKVLLDFLNGVELKI